MTEVIHLNKKQLQLLLNTLKKLPSNEELEKISRTIEQKLENIHVAKQL